MKSPYLERKVKTEFGKLHKSRETNKDLPGMLAIVLGVGLIHMERLLIPFQSENSLKEDFERH